MSNRLLALMTYVLFQSSSATMTRTTAAAGGSSTSGASISQTAFASVKYSDGDKQTERDKLDEQFKSRESTLLFVQEDGNVEDRSRTTGVVGRNQTGSEVESAVSTDLSGKDTEDGGARGAPFSPPTTSNRVSSQWAVVGSSITLRAEATGGNPPPRFQWRRNGIDVKGENAFLLSIDDVQPEDAGTYTCLIFNEAGETEWEEAVLHIGTPPVVEDQWQTYRLIPGAKLTIRALNARGMPSPSFQWRHNGVDIPGATSNALSISSASEADDGT